MKRWLLQISTLVVATTIASTAQAQVNLSWTDCGSFGTADKTFDCLSNSGAPNTLVSSFTAPAGANNVVGVEAVLDIIEANATLQPWWQFNTGECRAGGYTFNADFTSGPFNCIDFWGGQAVIVGGTVTDGAGRGPNTLRYKIAMALPGPTAMNAGDDIYGFKINILRTKSTGTGNCAGCLDPACVVLNSILVAQPAGVGDFFLSGPETSGRDFVTWQGGAGATCATVPTHNRTWGQVKALYR